VAVVPLLFLGHVIFKQFLVDFAHTSLFAILSMLKPASHILRVSNWPGLRYTSLLLHPLARCGASYFKSHLNIFSLLERPTITTFLPLVHTTNSSAMTDIQNPSPTATPNETRTYFSAILIQNHAISDTEAKALAKEWKCGNGAGVQRFK
jgi:hypothetical protein